MRLLTKLGLAGPDHLVLHTHTTIHRGTSTPSQYCLRDTLPHSYLVLQATPLQREEGSGHAATIKLWPR